MVVLYDVVDSHASTVQIALTPANGGQDMCSNGA